MKMDSIRESTAAGLSVTVRKTGIILYVQWKYNLGVSPLLVSRYCEGCSFWSI